MQESQSIHIYEIPACPICLGDLRNNIVALRCGHCFHKNCLQGVQKKKCPNCRKEFKKSQVIDIIYYANPKATLYIPLAWEELIKQNKKLKSDLMLLEEENKKTKKQQQKQFDLKIAEEKAKLAIDKLIIRGLYRQNLKEYKKKVVQAETDILSYKHLYQVKKDQLITLVIQKQKIENEKDKEIASLKQKIQLSKVSNISNIEFKKGILCEKSQNIKTPSNQQKNKRGILKKQELNDALELKSQWEATGKPVSLSDNDKILEGLHLD